MWVAKGAAAGVLAWFFGSWVSGFLKFAGLPILLNFLLGAWYYEASGEGGIVAARHASIAHEQAKVRIVASHFEPIAPGESWITKVTATIVNDGEGEWRNYVLHCDFVVPQGGLTRDGEFIDKPGSARTETIRQVLKPHTTLTRTFDLTVGSSSGMSVARTPPPVVCQPVNGLFDIRTDLASK